MSRKDIGRESVILTGTSAVAGLLFWMAVFLAGPLTLAPGAIVLLIGLFGYTRHANHGVILAERSALAALVAAQASLLAAICVHILPVVLRHVA